MRNILIFGGTTEGRELAEWCAANGIHADVSVTSDYGARLLGRGDFLNVFTGKLDCGEMKTLISAGDYAAVIDATHPYAAEATANIRAACADKEAPYYRLLRAECEVSGTCVRSMDELVGLLNLTDKVILSTLGSKEIPLLTAVNDRKRRVWIRALPAPGLAGQCEGCGFDPSHIITGKPPFSEEENIGHIKQSCAEILVTKECGTAGGYPEKIAAAARCGIETITVTRPRESGHTFAELTEIIRKSL